MAQKIFGLAIGGSGIVVVLVIAGIFLKVFDVSNEASNFAVWAGIIIGVFLGVLGIIGILKRMF
jgi:hypothetical protein